MNILLIYEDFSCVFLQVHDIYSTFRSILSVKSSSYIRRETKLFVQWTSFLHWTTDHNRVEKPLSLTLYSNHCRDFVCMYEYHCSWRRIHFKTVHNHNLQPHVMYVSALWSEHVPKSRHSDLIYCTVYVSSCTFHPCWEAYFRL